MHQNRMKLRVCPSVKAGGGLNRILLMHPKNAFLKATSLSHACHEWVPWIVRCSDNGRKCGKKCPYSPVIGHF